MSFAAKALPAGQTVPTNVAYLGGGSMNRLWVMGLFMSLFIHAAGGQLPKPTITAKVIETKVVYPCFQTGTSVSCNREQQIKAVIDGKTYWLQAKYTKDGLLELGTYPAELVKDQHSTNQKYWRSYRLEYTNGTSEEFTVVGQTE